MWEGTEDMRVVRRVLTTVMAAIALVMSLMVAGGAVASATTSAECPAGTSHSANGEGYGYVGPGTHSLRTGPSVSCSATTNLPDSTKVWFWCYVTNSSGNAWWWVRVDGKTTAGWMYEGNMNFIVISDENGDGVVDFRHC